MKKSALIDEMTAALTEAQRDEFEERAGILEFDGGMTRECSEFAAMALMYRSHPLEFMGLQLVRLARGQYALSLAASGDEAAAAVEMCPVGLACVVEALGGIALLKPPKSEETDVSITEEF
jgi:hypothetical protein